MNFSDILLRLNLMTAYDREEFLRNTGYTSISQLRLFLQKQQQHQLVMGYSEYEAQTAIMLYVSPFLLFFGCLGNILSFLILRQRLLSRKSTYLYLTSLTIADTLVLLIGLLRLWVATITGRDVADQSHWMCKLSMFLGYSTSDISVWLIIAVTAERYIVVCYPFWTNIICNIRNAKLIIATIVTVFIITNSHFFWTVEVMPSTSAFLNTNQTMKCLGGKNFKTLVGDAWPWVDAIIYSFIPMFIISILNCLIIRGVSEAKRCRHGYLQTRASTEIEHSSSRFNHETGIRLTLVLLTLSFAFLLTTLPMNILLIVSAIWQTLDNDYPIVAKFALAETVTKMLMYANHSMNFFLYCATGHKFRHQLIQLVCHRKFYPHVLCPHTPDTHHNGASRCLKPIHVPHKPHCINHVKHQYALTGRMMQADALHYTPGHHMWDRNRCLATINLGKVRTTLVDDNKYTVS